MECGECGTQLLTEAELLGGICDACIEDDDEGAGLPGEIDYPYGVDDDTPLY